MSDVPQPRPRPSGSDLPRRTTAAPTATAPTFHQASGSTNIFAPKIAAAVADTSGKSAEVVVCADAIELLKLLDYEQHFLEPRYCFCPPHLRLVFLYTRFSHACMCWWCLVGRDMTPLSRCYFACGFARNGRSGGHAPSNFQQFQDFTALATWLINVIQPSSFALDDDAATVSQATAVCTCSPSCCVGPGVQCASLLHPSCARRVLVVCSSCLVSNVPVSAATRVGGPDVTAQLAAVTPHALLRGHGVGVCLVLRCLAEQALRQRGWTWGSGPDHSADAEEAPPEEDLTQSVLAMDAYVCAVGVCACGPCPRRW